MRSALITGITGQDGSYLAEFLLEKGYSVHGITRMGADIGASLVRHLVGRVQISAIGLENEAELKELLDRVSPDEFYHLAGQTHVAESFERPMESMAVNALSTLRLLEICRSYGQSIRFFHASSSQVFGIAKQEPQDEQTPFCPVNPYGASKALATNLVRIYRDSHGCFAINGILFNHESPRRASGFVTAKICRAAAAIRLGRQDYLALGDTEAKRDWGHARDFVEGFWLAMQTTRPDDYVFATGELHSVAEVAQVAFETVGLEPGGFIRSDPSLLRKAEARRLVGNAAKAQAVLGWKPRIGFRQMITEMTIAALEELRLSSKSKAPPPDA